MDIQYKLLEQHRDPSYGDIEVTRSRFMVKVAGIPEILDLLHWRFPDGYGRKDGWTSNLPPTESYDLRVANRSGVVIDGFDGSYSVAKAVVKHIRSEGLL